MVFQLLELVLLDASKMLQIMIWELHRFILHGWPEKCAIASVASWWVPLPYITSGRTLCYRELIVGKGFCYIMADIDCVCYISFCHIMVSTTAICYIRHYTGLKRVNGKVWSLDDYCSIYWSVIGYKTSSMCTRQRSHLLPCLKFNFVLSTALYLLFSCCF